MIHAVMQSKTFIGTSVREYRFDRELGRGGMGTVYLATHVRLGRQVAVKVLPPHLAADATFIQRFEREARAVAALQHPNILAVHDMFEADGTWFLVMEYLGGGSVRDVMDREGALPVHRAAALVRDAALGLWAAAQAGFVHRDVKPDNLLLDDGGRVKVADFGLVRTETAATTLTETGTTVGTPAYMSPEQWEDGASCSHQSDLYSLGCTLYELLVGRPPFIGPTVTNFMTHHLTKPPPRPSTLRTDLPAAVEDVVMRLLAKQPIARYGSGEQVAAVLEPFTTASADRHLVATPVVTVAQQATVPQGTPVAGVACVTEPPAQPPEPPVASEATMGPVVGGCVAIVAAVAALVAGGVYLVWVRVDRPVARPGAVATKTPTVAPATLWSNGADERWWDLAAAATTTGPSAERARRELAAAVGSIGDGTCRGAVEVLRAMVYARCDDSAVFDAGFRLVKHHENDDPAGAAAVLEVLRPVAPESLDVDSLLAQLCQRGLVARPGDVDLSTALAAQAERRGDDERSVALLEPCVNAVGAGEGARILGQALVRRQDWARALPLLEAYTAERLPRLFAAREGLNRAGTDPTARARWQARLARVESVVDPAMALVMARIGRARELEDPERQRMLEASAALLRSLQPWVADETSYALVDGQLCSMLGRHNQARRLFAAALRRAESDEGAIGAVTQALTAVGAVRSPTRTTVADWRPPQRPAASRRRGNRPISSWRLPPSTPGSATSTLRVTAPCGWLACWRPGH